MSRRPPDFDDVVSSDVPAAERERLQRVHELLAQADPPPELSPELETVPWPDEALEPLIPGRRGRRRQRQPWLAWAGLAAAIALAAFVIGEGSATKSSSFQKVATRTMHGTALAPNARATIAVGSRGNDGNWPMLVDVTYLPPAQGGYYDLWLSRDGKPVALCGSFNTMHGAETVVRMSAAYSFRNINGWIVTEEMPSGKRLVMMTT